MEQTLIYNIKQSEDAKKLKKVFFDYTGLFYRLYNHFEESTDKNFIANCIERFPLIDKTLYDYCCTDVKMSLSSLEEIKKDKLRKLEQIDKELKEIDGLKRPTKRQKKHKVKLLRSRDETKRTMNKEICFGGKELLREITNLKQRKELTEKQQKNLAKKLKCFREARKRNIFLWGKACEGGNRKVDFHLTEDYIIFKINKKNQIRVNLSKYKDKKRKALVARLQELIDSNVVAVTVRIADNNVYITFDNEYINNYAFDMPTFNEALKLGPQDCKEARVRFYKATKIEFHTEKNERMLEGKMTIRGAGLDFNPEYIGFSIVDMNPKTYEVEKIVFQRTYSLTAYTVSQKISKETKKKLTRKHEYEIHRIYREIFLLCKHYKVSFFGAEMLTKITTKEAKDRFKEFNRLTKNVWCRKLQENIIAMKCGIQGIRLVPIDPMYTSFIGNIKYNYFDAANASIEIARRGYTKYIANISNRIYPTIENRDYEKMCYLLKTAVPITQSWSKLYKEFGKSCYGAGGWWRNKLLPIGKPLDSKKSMISYH